MDKIRYNRKIYLEDKPRAQARNEVLDAFDLPQEKEWIPASAALGRITADPVFANVSMPFYHASAMDGIAVNAEDTYEAHEQRPLHLKKDEQFVYVDTGNAIPPQYNAVIMVENIQVIDDETIEIIEPATPWQRYPPDWRGYRPGGNAVHPGTSTASC